MPETTNIYEIISTMRAVRRLKPNPVPDELINKIFQAAPWAPSGGNTKRWRVFGDQGSRDQEEGAGLL
jgi:nitroreductase